MAYMFEGRGPFPNKAGEFCGNWDVALPVPPDMRLGRPRPDCKTPRREANTIAELEAQGIGGLYWLTDQGSGAGLECNRGKEITEVPTPPGLTEPAVEGEADDGPR